MVYGTRVYRIISFIISNPAPALSLASSSGLPARPCGLRARDPQAIPRGAAARGRSRRGRRVSVTSLRRRARGRTEVSDPRRATAGRRRRSEIRGRSGPRGPCPWRPPGPHTFSLMPPAVGACARRRAHRDSSIGTVLRFPHVRTQVPAFSARASMPASQCAACA